MTKLTKFAPRSCADTEEDEKLYKSPEMVFNDDTAPISGQELQNL